ncbi:MMPL family transporter [Corynebacterium casei]|uniref:MMPL family transporter n=1 Tax=Corynebacterium casei TaxID=160386 RepID=UPI00264795D9|nr:MMPL family transporter [Corynebacterium casei]MDN5739880.1 MMPL family transporter [Corynebacterium casei]MDN5799378.1 MMPL family transporter [Corynebacterium casei]MDN5825684.1 MMPL family transporter [Corynebacterium casei]MDN5921644.1 MMPL family transporter [Corynebacterium casei]MDN6262193.1 MMPL family transporter [Corynebacterium casei]
MFLKWGRFSYAYRKLIPFVLIGVILFLFGVFGTQLGNKMSQEGWDDPNSASTQAAKIENEVFGRDNSGDVIVMVNNPQDNLEEGREYVDNLKSSYPDQIAQVNSYFDTQNPNLLNEEGNLAFVAIGLAGDEEQTLKDFRIIQDALTDTELDVEVAGATAVADALDAGMADDIARAERAALPLVGLLLLVVFGSVVAAFMPLVVGGLSILGSIGILGILAGFLQVNVFAQAVVTLLGLGLAIDYGLFMVSRFREELDKGREVKDAVAVTTATAGQTVVFSAAMVAVALSGLFIFPQAFLKSVAYGSISAVGLAALLSVTLLPALFGLLGHNIDKWSIRRTKRTARQLEDTWWYRLPKWAMKRAKLMTVAICGLLIALTIPIVNISFGGINETYLPPTQETRVAQDKFNEEFPSFRTEPVKLVVENASNEQLVDVIMQVRELDGLTAPMAPSSATVDGTTVLSAGIEDRDDYADIVHELENLNAPEGVNLYVGGTPAMEVESLDALFDKLPWMVLYILVATFILMALVFGSVVLPMKAILMTILTVGATLGILTAMFVSGVGAGLLSFSPGPLMSPILVLIIAIIYGLSTDYEVFLVSRMVEARKQGASTDEAINYGTAHTGGIITAAALIMIVVAAAFGFSDIVMMKYIAFGMIFALFIDATIVRMLLVPAVMHLLREDNWWAPKFIHKAYEKLGHGSEPQLEPAAPKSSFPAPDTEGAVAAGATATAAQPKPQAQPEPHAEQQPSAAQESWDEEFYDSYEDAAEWEEYEDNSERFEEDHMGEESEDGPGRSGRTIDEDESLVPFNELMERLARERRSINRGPEHRELPRAEDDNA